MLALKPDVRSPTRDVTRTRRNLILALPAKAALYAFWAMRPIARALQRPAVTS